MMKSTLAAFAIAALTVAGAAQASHITFQADLSGAAESPANASPGVGTTTVIFDSVGHTMQVIVDFSGLLGGITAAHLHCCTPVPGVGNIGVASPVPSFPGFPTGVTSGHYDQIFDTTASATWNPAFITANGGTASGAESAMLAGLLSGRVYLNLHTTFRTGGEIRGFLAQVPEPATLALAALGLLALTASRRQRQ